jgi:hypothetical protein
VALTCVNLGRDTATNVTGFIELPANVELAFPTDTQRKTFSPAAMAQYTGGPPPILTWYVRLTRNLPVDTELDFRFVAGGMAPNGIPADSMEARCRVRVPGVAPQLACTLTLPDSLPLNGSGTDVEPNPFPVLCTVWNKGSVAATVGTVSLDIPKGEDLHLVASTPATILVNRTLAPGASVAVTWIVRVTNRATPRTTTFTATACDSTGMPSCTCSAALPIANLRTPLACSASTSDTVIAYIPVLQQYQPVKWAVTGTLTNISGAPLSNLTAEISLEDSSLAPYVTFDPDPARDNTNPKTWPILFPQSDHPFTWHFTLAAPNSTGAPVTPAFIISYRSSEASLVTNGCRVPVAIQPVASTLLRCQAAASKSVILFDTATHQYPQPAWSVTGSLTNTGGIPLTNVTAELRLADSALARYVMFDPAPALDNANPKTAPLLPPQRTQPFTWHFLLAAPNTTGAAVAPVFTIAYRSDQTVFETGGCTVPVEIQPAGTAAVSCSAAASDTIIAYDPATKRYLPSSWSVTGTLANTGTVPLTNLTARIALADSSLARYLRFDPAHDSTNPRALASLAPLAAQPFTWFFTMAAPNATGLPVRPSFIIRYSSDELPNPAAGCATAIEIQSMLTGIGQLSGAASQPDVFPDPSGGELTVRIPSRPGEAVRITVMDLLGRTIASSSGESAAAGFEARIRIAPPIPGTYLLLLRSGERLWMRTARLY